MKVKAFVIAALFESVKSVKLSDENQCVFNCHTHSTSHSYETVHHHHVKHHHDKHHDSNSGVKAILGSIIGVNPIRAPKP